MADPKSADQPSPALLKAWQDYSAACQAMFERLSGPSPMNGGGNTPFEFLGAWKDFAENLGMRTDFAAGQRLKPEDMFARFFPALGISREYEEIARRMQELTVQFQRRNAEFAQHSADIGQSALQAFQKRASGDESMQASPAALYDAWVDSAEEAYAGAAHSEPFARMLADLCNILSAFKVERGKLLEAVARQFDWPSRAEVDSLNRRVMALTAAANHIAPPPSPPSPPPASRGARVRKSKARKPSKRPGR